MNLFRPSFFKDVIKTVKSLNHKQKCILATEWVSRNVLLIIVTLHFVPLSCRQTSRQVTGNKLIVRTVDPSKPSLMATQNDPLLLSCGIFPQLQLVVVF